MAEKLSSNRLVDKLVQDYKAAVLTRAKLMEKLAADLRDSAKKLEYYAGQAETGRFFEDVVQDSTMWTSNTVIKIKNIDHVLESLQWVRLYIEDQEDEKNENEAELKTKTVVKHREPAFIRDVMNPVIRRLVDDRHL